MLGVVPIDLDDLFSIPGVSRALSAYTEKRGRVLSEAEFTSWRPQTSGQRQLSAPSAPLTSSRAETASIQVDLAGGVVEAKGTVRKNGGTGRSVPLGLATHAVVAFPEEVKRHGRGRVIFLAFRLQNASEAGVCCLIATLPA
jgi:hypothetical protein